MKTSDKIRIVSLIHSKDNICPAISNEMASLEIIDQTFGVSWVTPLTKEWQRIYYDVRQLQTNLIDHKAKLEQEILSDTTKLMAQDLEWYDPNISYEFQLKYRTLLITKETKQKVIDRLRFYTDWRYPALEIGPGQNVWTKHLVGFDPLYLVDRYSEPMIFTKNQYKEPFRSRIRTYLTDETNLNFLPSSEFGFVFSWNVFNYLPFNVIIEYLREIYCILRPGGTVMFSYNNAERAESMVRVEDKFMTCVPKTMLRDKAIELGYKITTMPDEDSMLSWAEFKKPGTLESIKTHQPLGQIIEARAENR